MKTLCNRCIFKKDDKCLFNKDITKEGNQYYTLGCCRTFRSSKWLDKQKNKDSDSIAGAMMFELSLSFDLILLTNKNSLNNTDRIKRTLEGDWKGRFCNNIYVVDKIGDNKNTVEILKYISSLKDKRIRLDKPTQEESDAHSISRISRMLNRKTKYFMVLNAGDTLKNIIDLSTSLADGFQNVIQWQFPTNGQFIDPLLGLFLYNGFMCFNDKHDGFVSNISKWENDNRYSLRWTFSQCEINPMT